MIGWQEAVLKLVEKEKRMAEQVVRLTVDLTVNEGKLDAFMTIAETMTAVCQTEFGTLGYDWFSSADKKRFRLMETYANADAVFAHFTGPVVQELVPKLAALCSVGRFEVYGDPGSKMKELAAGFGAEIFEYWTGINR